MLSDLHVPSHKNLHKNRMKLVLSPGPIAHEEM